MRNPRDWELEILELEATLASKHISGIFKELKAIKEGKGYVGIVGARIQELKETVNSLELDFKRITKD